MGEELDSMSLKELQCLEQQLDTGLKNIRTRKVHILNYTLFSLHMSIFEFPTPHCIYRWRDICVYI